MSVKVVRYRLPEKDSPPKDSNAQTAHWGIVQGDQVCRLNLDSKTLGEFIESGGLQLAKERALESAGTSGQKYVRLDDVVLLSPVTDPCSIVCQGKNYGAHLRETGSTPQDQPFNLLFSKASSSLTSGVGSIYRPPGVTLLDYELELGLVIARKIEGAIDFKSADLSEYLAGVVIANDVSARDVQVPEGQWFRGKSFRTFCPVGPYLVLLTPEEMKRLPELKLKLTVNGVKRQEGQVSQMIYSPVQTLKLVSEFMNLRPGDLILTGTPAGVAMQVRRDLKTKLAQAFLSPSRLKELFIEKQKTGGRFLNKNDLIESTIRTEDGALDLGRQRLLVQE